MSHIFRYRNININYSSTGEGNTIVLLHGFLGSISMWKEIIPILSKNKRIIAIDLLGHGKTGNLGFIHTMEDQAEMIKALLSSLKLRKIAFIGHSMGGYAALAFANLFPKFIKSICLLNSTAYPDSIEKKKNKDRAISLVKKNHKLFVQVSIPYLFSEENKKNLKSEIKSTINEALKTSKQGIIASLEGMKIRRDQTLILKNPNFKTFIILGEKDVVLDYKTHCKQIRNTTTKLIILSHGHMSHIEDKEKLILELEKISKLAI